MNALSKSNVDRVLAGLVIIIPPYLTLQHYATAGGPDFISSSLLIVMYILTGFGITIMFHRYFVHHSFDFVHPSLAYGFGILGLMAFQGELSKWMAGHLKHHHRTDVEGDPHSPYRFGTTWWAIIIGFIYSHFGWFFVESAFPEAARLRQKQIILWMDRLFLPAAIAGLLLPGFVGALVRGSFSHLYDDVVWAGFARVALVQHSTWCVNSVCHLWGDRSFNTGDHSTNNWVIAILALGEGNHRCHHKFPNSARHGLLPGQFDPSYYVIRGLEKLGLVTNIRQPSETEIHAALSEHPAPV